jgi:hypothetical protein
MYWIMYGSINIMLNKTIANVVKIFENTTAVKSEQTLFDIAVNLGLLLSPVLPRLAL